MLSTKGDLLVASCISIQVAVEYLKCSGKDYSMTSGPNVAEVNKFVGAIKQREKLLDGCRRFHEIEPRDIAYVVCSKLVSQMPGDISHILAGARIFLQVWNAVYIQHQPQNVKQSMEEDIRHAYLSCSVELNLLAKDRLDNIDLTQGEKAAAVTKAYTAFAQYTSIADTGATKVLHLLNPALFMMWDTKIREAYHTLLPDQLWIEFIQKFNEEQRKQLEKLTPFMRKQSIEKTPQFKSEWYLLFMGTCQQIAQALVKDTSESELWSHHITFIKDNDFIRSWGFSETVAKMIDECNFVRWARGTDF